MSRERHDIKDDLIKLRGQRCEHPQGCEVTSYKELTVDHFTPKCIAKELGWNFKQTNSPENTQLLCKEHHREKDESTPDRVQMLREQRRGRNITLQTIIEFNQGIIYKSEKFTPPPKKRRRHHRRRH